MSGGSRVGVQGRIVVKSSEPHEYGGVSRQARGLLSERGDKYGAALMCGGRMLWLAAAGNRLVDG